MRHDDSLAAMADRLDLGARQIHLWCSFYSQIDDEVLLERYRSVLSEPERKQQRRFHFERDRRRYLVTRALVRTVLARYATVAPSDWFFSANEYGRPLIANDDAAARHISFNITHTEGLIILAVGRDCALGVDAENVHVRAAPIDIAQRFFAPEEVRALYALPQEQRPRGFFSYWTLKESYIKARSKGLSIPLDHFEFRLAGDEIQIAIDPQQNDAPSRWRFWQLWLAPYYLAAVCAERTCAEAPQLVVRKIVPLVGEQDLPYTVVRASR